MRLQNKVAIVTGAATVSGRRLRSGLRRRARRCSGLRGTPVTPNQTLEAIKTVGGKAIAVAADVSKPDQVQHLIDATVSAFGRLDIVVNNAGIEKIFAFVDIVRRMQKILAVNLVGPFLVSQSAARQMIRRTGWANHQYLLRSTKTLPCRPTRLTAPARAACGC